MLTSIHKDEESRQIGARWNAVGSELEHLFWPSRRARVDWSLEVAGEFQDRQPNGPRRIADAGVENSKEPEVNASGESGDEDG